MEPYFIYMRANLQCYMCVKEVYCHFPYDYTWNNALSSSLSYLCNHQFSSDNGLAMRRNISNVGTLRDRRAAQSHFGTAPAPGHVRQVNNLVFWTDDATATRGQLGGRIRFGYGQCGGESGTEFE